MNLAIYSLTVANETKEIERVQFLLALQLLTKRFHNRISYLTVIDYVIYLLQLCTYSTCQKLRRHNQVLQRVVLVQRSSCGVQAMFLTMEELIKVKFSLQFRATYLYPLLSNSGGYVVLGISLTYMLFNHRSNYFIVQRSKLARRLAAYRSSFPAQ